jgi:site-specific recombinase XerC
MSLSSELGNLNCPKAFKEPAKEYLDREKSLLSPKEHKRQASILEEHLRPFFGGKLGEISAQSVEQYIALRSRKCSAATIRKEVGVLKHLLNRTLKEGKISKNPLAGVTMPNCPLTASLTYSRQNWSPCVAWIRF